MDNDGLWICYRQRDGPLVKETRCIRPRLSQQDGRDDRKDKNAIIRAQRIRQLYASGELAQRLTDKQADILVRRHSRPRDGAQCLAYEPREDGDDE